MNDKAEFEKVIQGLGYVPAWDGDQYLYEEVEVAWQAWQAARAQGGEAVGWIRPSIENGDGWKFTANKELAETWSRQGKQVTPVYTHPSASGPDGWREKVEKAARLAAVFDDGGDGSDDESARSVVAILNDLLTTTPQPAPPVPEGWRSIVQSAIDGLSIINESDGVAGWHMNGAIATWDEVGVTDVREDLIGALELELEPEPSVSDGYVLIEKGVTPTHVLEAGLECFRLLNQSGIADDRTLILSVFQDMLLAVAKDALTPPAADDQEAGQ